MRTRAEVISFFESKVGTTVNDKLNSNLNGQCVTLEKALLEFLGVASPYAARGNAKDYANKLLQQDIATDGKGWLNVVVNPTMGVVNGVTYGHIWSDLGGQVNYEQNGAKALVTTKNTRPLLQGRQFVNLDKWVTKGEDMKATKDIVRYAFRNGLLNEPSRQQYDYWVGKDTLDLLKNIDADKGHQAIADRQGKLYDELKTRLAACEAGDPRVQKFEEIKKITEE